MWMVPSAFLRRKDRTSAIDPASGPDLVAVSVDQQFEPCDAARLSPREMNGRRVSPSGLDVIRWTLQSLSSKGLPRGPECYQHSRSAFRLPIINSDDRQSTCIECHGRYIFTKYVNS